MQNVNFLAIGSQGVSSPRETTLAETVDHYGCAQQLGRGAADDEVDQAIRRRILLDSQSGVCANWAAPIQHFLTTGYGRSTRPQAATGHTSLPTRKLLRGTTTHSASRRAPFL